MLFDHLRILHPACQVGNTVRHMYLHGLVHPGLEAVWHTAGVKQVTKPVKVLNANKARSSDMICRQHNMHDRPQPSTNAWWCSNAHLRTTVNSTVSLQSLHAKPVTSCWIVVAHHPCPTMPPPTPTRAGTHCHTRRNDARMYAESPHHGPMLREHTWQESNQCWGSTPHTLSPRYRHISRIQVPLPTQHSCKLSRSHRPANM
jgi:hypothetical protein